MNKIVVIGLSGESIFMSVDHFNDKGETVNATSFHTEPGGKGYNQALALFKQGADVTFITALGRDIYSNSTINGLKESKIDYQLILKNKPTATAVIITDKTGENHVTVYRGVNDSLLISDLLAYENVIKNAVFMLLQQEMPIEVVRELIKFGYNNNVKVILNPAPAVLLDKDIFKYLYLITPNEQEAKIIFGLSNNDRIDDVIKKAQEYNISRMIITLGEKGSLVYEYGKLEWINSIKVNAVDTTGAGDVYNASVVNYLSEGKSLIEAAKYASIASGLSVTKRGVIDSLPTKEEILKEFKNGKIS